MPLRWVRVSWRVPYRDALPVGGGKQACPDIRVADLAGSPIGFRVAVRGLARGAEYLGLVFRWIVRSPNEAAGLGDESVAGAE
jgi:hypothetical protein